MSTADFLLELLSEEVPARMQARARNDLARMFAEQLASAGLSHDGIVTYSTPRRLALIARGLPLATEAVSEEIKGPKTSAPPHALDGFLRKTGLSQGQLEDRDGTWFAVIDRPGRATTDVIKERIPSIIFQFPWPKSMRWGAESASSGSLRWVRPLHNVMAILGNEHIPIDLSSFANIYANDTGDMKVVREFTSVTSSPATLGHRFHHPGPITIGGAHDYVEKLRACHVIVDQEEREAIVRKGAVEAAEHAGFLLVEDEGLVVENAGLTEWPVPLFGSFDADYLDVPEEVIALTARTNQKYFVMRDPAGKLAPHFVCVANISANDDGAAIVAGNERVLAARLSDARFFWEQDLKVPLEEQARKLEQIVFHEKLGTVADKVERVAKLARWLVEEGIVKDADPDQTERAARLAKADLVTGMVGEFPELQGIIGGHLARAQGEPDAIADAIRDHYKPVGQGDEVPTAPVTVAVSLADKLDTLIGFFAARQRPTGSKDPFALRRAALGALGLAAANNLRFSLNTVFALVADLLEDTLNSNWENWESADFFDVVRDDPNYRVEGGSIFYGNRQIATAGKLSSQVDFMEVLTLGLRAAPDDLFSFMVDRLKVQQRDAGVRHDLIDAVFALGGEDDLVRLLARVTALQAFVETGEGTNLLAGYKRAANILKKENWTGRKGVMSVPGSQGISQTGEEDPLVLVEEPAIAEAVAEMAEAHRSAEQISPEEAALREAVERAEPQATAAIEAEDFTSAMSALASLRAPIDAFFDKVIVNDPDADIRARRLNLLLRFRDAVNRVADFSKIEG